MASLSPSTAERQSRLERLRRCHDNLLERRDRARNVAAGHLLLCHGNRRGRILLSRNNRRTGTHHCDSEWKQTYHARILPGRAPLECGMRLSSLLLGLATVDVNPDVTAITEDSRRVTGGAVFVAISGYAEDGHAYIPDASRRGAVAVVTDRAGQHELGDAVLVRVHDSRSALATMAARFYREPARDLHMIGFTGTFGKTSTSDVLRALLAPAGLRPGVLGSLGARYRDFQAGSDGLTTPAPVQLHRALRGLLDAGADTVIMEVTSHALRMRRAEGITFRGGLLAAIRPGEHTDFHRSYEDYLEAKRLFLQYLAPDALLAYDADNHGARQLVSSRDAGRSIGFSLDGRAADLIFSHVRASESTDLSPGGRTSCTAHFWAAAISGTSRSHSLMRCPPVCQSTMRHVSSGHCSRCRGEWSDIPPPNEPCSTTPRRTRKASAWRSRSRRRCRTGGWP